MLRTSFLAIQKHYLRTLYLADQWYLEDDIAAMLSILFCYQCLSLPCHEQPKY